MKIAVYPIQSLLRHDEIVSKESNFLLEELEKTTGFTYELTNDLTRLNESNLALILVQSGGSESFFKKEIFPLFKGPFYLLTYGASNSLAASLEILTFIKQQNYAGEILHGDINYIADRIKSLALRKTDKELIRLGVFAKPSDWLISSNVDYEAAKKVFGINLIDVNQEEISETIKKHHESANPNLFKSSFPQNELDKAYQIHLAMDELVKKYALKGYTLRCFDILGLFHMSACLAMAIHNERSIIASCEGDIPAMITAYSILDALNLHSFQCNPQWIDPVKNTIELAHCTFPLDMVKEYHFDTHFESGIGLGIHGEFLEGPCTIVKVDASLREFYVEEGEILTNECRNDRCRSQVRVHLDAPVSYFLKSSLGNHHLLVYGKQKATLKDYFEAKGLREVVG